MIPVLLAAALMAPGLPVAEPLASGCHIQRKVYVLNLDNHVHAPVLRHVWAAVRSGQPEILHIDRADADAHRRASLAGIPKVPGKDLDEYPPAATREGGAGADVRAIDPHANRSAGAIQGARLAPFCDGQAWRYERKPGPK